MPKIRLTTTALRTLVPQCTDRIYWDETLPGFGVKVTPKGHRCYVVQYRNSYGVDRRMTLSDVRVLTIEQARTRAKEVLAKVTLGGDPAKDKQDDRKCITINDILDLYMANHIEKKGANTQRSYRAMYKNYVRPFMGTKLWKDITQDDCQKLLDHVTETSGEGNGNNAVGYLRSAWNWCIPKILPMNSNPTFKVEMNEKKSRDVVIDENEYRELYKALVAHRDANPQNNPSMYMAIEMIIFTAARKMEVLSMQWDAVKDGYIHVTDKGNSRRRKPKIKQIVITEPVQELLGRIPKNSKWLFARSTAPELHITSVDEVWCDVRKEAGLPHVNIHDLRRSWITFAIDDLKISLETVSKAVGHSSPEVTRIHYNKIARKTKLKANHDIAEGLASAMMGD